MQSREEETLDLGAFLHLLRTLWWNKLSYFKRIFWSMKVFAYEWFSCFLGWFHIYWTLIYPALTLAVTPYGCHSAGVMMMMAPVFFMCVSVFVCVLRGWRGALKFIWPSIMRYHLLCEVLLNPIKLNVSTWNTGR